VDFNVVSLKLFLGCLVCIDRDNFSHESPEAERLPLLGAISSVVIQVEKYPGTFELITCGNIPYQETLRVVTGYRHCRFVMMSHTQTAIDLKVDSLILLFVVDFSLCKISF
jgi:hypothetical protein